MISKKDRERAFESLGEMVQIPVSERQNFLLDSTKLLELKGDLSAFTKELEFNKFLSEYILLSSLSLRRLTFSCNSSLSNFYDRFTDTIEL